nr:hypothetical protein [Mycoplasmopsis bovis]
MTVCRIRKAKRTKESKNVAVTFQNIASRDYDGIYNDIYATDVTYIFANRCWSKFCIYERYIIKPKKF